MDLSKFKPILEADDVLVDKPPNPFKSTSFTVAEINMDLDRKILKCENFINAFRDYQNEFYREEEFAEQTFNIIYDVKQIIKELENYKITVNKSTN